MSPRRCGRWSSAGYDAVTHWRCVARRLLAHATSGLDLYLAAAIFALLLKEFTINLVESIITDMPPGNVDGAHDRAQPSYKTPMQEVQAAADAGCTDYGVLVDTSHYIMCALRRKDNTGRNRPNSGGPPGGSRTAGLLLRAKSCTSAGAQLIAAMYDTEACQCQ